MTPAPAENNAMGGPPPAGPNTGGARGGVGAGARSA